MLRDSDKLCATPNFVNNYKFLPSFYKQKSYTFIQPVDT